MGLTSNSKSTSDGQGLVEYALLLVLILIVVFGGLVLAGPAVVPIAYDADNPLVGVGKDGRGAKTLGESAVFMPIIAPERHAVVCTSDFSFTGAKLDAGMDAARAILPAEQFRCNMGETLGALHQGAMSISPVLPEKHYLWIVMERENYVFHGGLPYVGEPAFSGPIRLAGRDLLAWEGGGAATFQAYYFGTDVTRPWKGTLTVSSEVGAEE